MIPVQRKLLAAVPVERTCGCSLAQSPPLPPLQGQPANLPAVPQTKDASPISKQGKVYIHAQSVQNLFLLCLVLEP